MKQELLFVTKSCPTLSNPMDCNPPGSSVHGISQARMLEKSVPSPGDLPDPGIELRPPVLQADSLLSEPPGKAPYFLLFLPISPSPAWLISSFSWVTSSVCKDTELTSMGKNKNASACLCTLLKQPPFLVEIALALLLLP